VPRRTIEYRGVRMEEMDVDAHPCPRTGREPAVSNRSGVPTLSL
jgi:hypothetical protein